MMNSSSVYVCKKVCLRHTFFLLNMVTLINNIYCHDCTKHLWMSLVAPYHENRENHLLYEYPQPDD